MAISELILEVIKQFIKQNNYQFKFDTVSNKAVDKSYQFMINKGFTEKSLAETVILNLKSTDYYKNERDDNDTFNNGDIFFFRTRQLNETLYVKVKILDDHSMLLIMSIHSWGQHC